MRLEFGVAVRTDFAVEVDLFVLRCGPFHRRRSFSLVIQDGERVSQLTKEGNSPNAPQDAATGRLRTEDELPYIDKMKRGNRSRS